MRRPRALALAFALNLLAAGAVAAGCGSGAATDDDDGQPRFLTAAQVSERFVTATGDGKLLRRTDVPDEAWVQLGPGLNPSAEVRERYGTFVVYVVKPGHRRAVDSLMRGKPASSASTGELRWELDTLSGTWVANKRYGANVVLAWFSAQKTPVVDERFRRLDRILAGLTG